MERTFVMIKSDGVQRGLVGDILTRIEKKGYRLIKAELKQPDRNTVEAHYAEHKDRPYFQSLVSFILEGPVMAIVVEGENIIKVMRLMIGDKNPGKAIPGTIRGDYAKDTTRNLIHGADSIESAQREIAIWFPDEG
ncbi:nucleoside-diphosphate kinase [Isachenkonia alkalipeptolytica]|uniref:Nucleoside diphosphate kinase n=1 Tax=Isachenkonia alkalipeptolytica TaxID=2565777 RepID=A0AA43XKN7_9CLOT|nr:nucleoside-diphosphate kinase [Isachenkonia alkalipeptolytica]NBG88502.1 nucleoside-diphosphate kinase [Isachenkonia alkalipeptolytica]